jgi:alkylhydroperoxidase family enzyme
MRALHSWRDSDAFTPLERLVLELADAITATPATPRPDVLDQLRKHLQERQIVELALTIAWEGLRARFNRAFGVQPQDYAAGAYCVLPASHASSP